MAKILEKLAIGGIEFTVRSQNRNQTIYPVNCRPRISFAFPKDILDALELFNIQSHANPQQQRSIVCPERFGASEEPAVVSLSVTDPVIVLTALARAQTV